ncbi:hypothetical protein ACMWPW_08015 [Helicobacter pylori]|uniref:hypothetical protein n=1 Tax=Helicobacter pylori TaxID=210 RepID=UPI0039E10A6C
MKQKVHSVSYLAKAEFEFTDGVYNLVALPSGAEVVNVFLEVVGDPKAGNVSVGFKDEATKNYFLSLEIEQYRRGTSLRSYTATSNKVVVAEVQAAEGSAKGVLKVVYFLPSVIEVEY